MKAKSIFLIVIRVYCWCWKQKLGRESPSNNPKLSLLVLEIYDTESACCWVSSPQQLRISISCCNSHNFLDNSHKWKSEPVLFRLLESEVLDWRKSSSSLRLFVWMLLFSGLCVNMLLTLCRLELYYKLTEAFYVFSFTQIFIYLVRILVKHKTILDKTCAHKFASRAEHKFYINFNYSIYILCSILYFSGFKYDTWIKMQLPNTLLSDVLILDRGIMYPNSSSKELKKNVSIDIQT